MIPIILGGIAGVVTGYALKKYLDEEECYCPQHEESVSDTVHINALEPLNTIKQKLNKSLFRKTEALMSAIENLGSNTPRSVTEEPNAIQTLESTPEIEAEITEFCHILTRAEQVQHALLDELIKPFFEIDDANHLGEEERAKATRFIEIDTLMREACVTPITLDGASVSTMAKMAFHTLFMCIDENNNPESNEAFDENNLSH